MIEKFDSSKERIIQEFVPGKQITLAHIIPNPVSDLYSKMGMIDGDGAIGIFTITMTAQRQSMIFPLKSPIRSSLFL